MGKNMKRIFQFIISTIFILSTLIGGDYYIYCTAESEDEVALIRFDGKVAHVEKRIPVGVWPVEIEGPHGITCLLYTSPSPRDPKTSRMPSSA